MIETLKCSNCEAPLVPDPKKPTLVCAYCGFHLKNTLFAPPRPRHPPHQPAVQRPPVSKYMWLFYVVPLALAALGAIPAILIGSRSSPSVKSPSAISVRRPVDPVRHREEVLSKYVGCLDSTYWHMKQSNDRYRSWRKKQPERAPTCKERRVYGLYEVRGAGCKANLERIEKEGNAGLSDLDRLARDYGAAIDELAPLTKTATSYYNKKGYLLDDCAKGQALHPKLMAAFKKVAAAGTVFRALLAKETTGALKRCIERSARSPQQKGTLLWAKMIQAAGDTVAVLRVQWKSTPPDLQAIKAAMARFDEASTAADAMTEEQKKVSGYNSWSSSKANDLAAAGIAFLKSRAGRRFSHSRRVQIRWGWDKHRIDGTFEKVVRKYVEIIGQMHSMKDCGRLLKCEDDQCPEPR
jgi:hypothetical protein